MIYDLLILGGGPAGYLAAERASEHGFKCLLIEKEHIGGVCLNEGCVPSKSLLYSAKIYESALHGESSGVIVKDIKLDHSAVMKKKAGVIDFLVGGIKSKLKKLKVDIISETGVIQPKTADGFVVSAGAEKYTGKRLLIATGSSSAVPPIKGVKEAIAGGFVLTNREILSLAKVPKNLVIIGGGVIGLEMASYYNTAGSNVTVIEMLGNIAGYVDKDISSLLLKTYTEKGVKFNLNCKVTEITKTGVVFEQDGKPFEVNADKVLLSVGRRPNTENIGLENLGVFAERGFVKVDEQMRTNIAGVYAAGDVNGLSMLAHSAYRQSEVAVNVMFGKTDKVNYDAIPSVIYTNPEAAAVGFTEESAKAKGLDVKCVKLPFVYSGRYVAESGGDGFIKLIIDKNADCIVGCHMVGSYVSEFILSAVIMVDRKMRIEDIKKFVFPHPTVCEVLREAIFA